MDEAPDRFFEKQEWQVIDEDDKYVSDGDAQEHGGKEEEEEESDGDQERSCVIQEDKGIEDRLYWDVWVNKRGPMMAQERSQCCELGLDVMGQVEMLAKSCKG